MQATPNTDEIWRLAEARAPDCCALSDRIWARPELNFQEGFAAGEHAAMLEREGFAVSRGVAGLPTAVMGQAGAGGPVIAILGEYDALPGLSQAAGVAAPQPLEPGGGGHGCGHNMLGSASLLAAAAVKDWLARSGVPGTVRYLGCPAEEGGSAKGFMVRDGVFDDVDVAISWHPNAFTGVTAPVSLACAEIEFTFHGRATHAAASPHLGRSALDAVELMNVGVNYMREHMPSSARVHYAITDAGGSAPNVVQARATVRHLVRARTLAEMWTLVERVRRIADGAALMTETRVESRQLSGDANLVGNKTLEALMHRELVRLGGPGFDAADHAFAREIQATLGPEDIKAAYARRGLPPRTGEALFDEICPLEARYEITAGGSTDVGTVSWAVPTVQCIAACYAVGTPGHSWQLVAQGRMPAAHKGLALAAKAMASVAKALFEDPGSVARARAEFMEFRRDNEFVNPIGPELAPPLDMAST
jgi:aminobenzoyl-glutamate utilization protein B